MKTTRQEIAQMVVNDLLYRHSRDDITRETIVDCLVFARHTTAWFDSIEPEDVDMPTVNEVFDALATEEELEKDH